MKIIIVVLLLLTTSLHAGWFENKVDKQRIQITEQQLVQQREATGAWQIVARVFAVGGISLLFVGAALGSRIRRHGNSK